MTTESVCYRWCWSCAGQALHVCGICSVCDAKRSREQTIRNSVVTLALTDQGRLALKLLSDLLDLQLDGNDQKAVSMLLSAGWRSPAGAARPLIESGTR